MIRSAPTRLFGDVTSAKRRPPTPAIPPSCSNNYEHIDMLEEMRNPGYAIPEIETSSFVAHLLPPLRDGISIENIVASLIGEGAAASGQSWISHRSTRSDGLKDSCGTLLASIHNLLERASSLAVRNRPHLQKVIRMVLPRPRQRRASRQKMSLQRAYFVLKEFRDRSARKTTRGNQAHSWPDIALAAEVKTEDTPESREEVSDENILSDRL